MATRVTRGGHSKYRQSYSGVGEMLRSKMLQAEMHNRAELVAAKARSLAPVDSGEYVRSFKVTSGIRRGRKSRAVGTVTNTSDHAFFIEFGNKNIKRHRVLGRALRAAGNRGRLGAAWKTNK